MPTYIAPEGADTSASRPNHGLYYACLFAGIYGVVFGLYLIPTGLFVGPHILFAAVAHIALGVGFLISATGLKRGRTWATWTTLLLSSVTAIIGAVAFIQSVIDADSANLVFWGIFTALFLVFATLAVASSKFWKWRFSLRTLLLATTLVAVVLGLVVYLAR